MKRFSLLYLAIIFSIFLKAQGESFYTYIIQQELGGKREVKVQSGRADIINDGYAIEVDFSKKWKEAIGQSIWYGLNTNLQPGIVLIRKGKTDTYHFQLFSALEYAGLTDKIKVWLYPDDFPNAKKLEAELENKYWLNLNGRVRHNASCTSFMNTKKGKFCKPNKGRACGKCKG